MLGGGFLFPFFLLNLYFVANGHFSEFYHVTYEIPATYSAAKEFVFSDLLMFLLTFTALHFVVLLFFVLSMVKLIKERNRYLFLAVTWFLFVWIGISMPAKWFGHYMHQLYLPVAFFAPWFLIGSSAIYERALEKRRKLINYASLGLLLFLSIRIFFMFYLYVVKDDIPREIALFLSERISVNDTVYVDRDKHVLYLLLDKEVPTKYIHPTLISRTEHVKALNIDADREMEKILRKSPKFLIIYKDHPSKVLQKEIAENYKLVKKYRAKKDDIHIYEKKNE